MVESKFHRLATVTRFRAYLKVPARIEKHTQTAPHDRKVIGK